jgi:hypothetical protein
MVGSCYSRQAESDHGVASLRKQKSQPYPKVHHQSEDYSQGTDEPQS